MSIRKSSAIAFTFALSLSATAVAETPSFDCRRKLNDAEKIVCNDDALAALDRKLAGILARAMQSLPRDKTVAYFVAEQQDWARDRDGCPTTRNPVSCLSSVYRTRIAELQGRFQLVPSRGPFRFTCDSNPPREIVVTWYETDPPSGVLETARGQTTMFATPMGSGIRYIGDDVAYSEHQGAVTVTWGTEAQELKCTPEK
jgi:uncharacterized protein